jgi:hypothetical protein
MYCITLLQVILLRGFLVALNGSAYTTDGKPKGAFITKEQTEALIWAMGLLVTELISVLLIAWSLSILYRLACSQKITLNVEQLVFTNRL